VEKKKWIPIVHIWRIIHIKHWKVKIITSVSSEHIEIEYSIFLIFEPFKSFSFRQRNWDETTKIVMVFPRFNKKCRSFSLLSNRHFIVKFFFGWCSTICKSLIWDCNHSQIGSINEHRHAIIFYVCILHFLLVHSFSPLQETCQYIYAIFKFNCFLSVILKSESHRSSSFRKEWNSIFFWSSTESTFQFLIEKTNYTEFN
jgi:hypothetical protein